MTQPTDQPRVHQSIDADLAGVALGDQCLNRRLRESARKLVAQPLVRALQDTSYLAYRAHP